MTALLALVEGLAGDMLFAAFVVFLRVGAAMAMLPAFGEQSLPQRVRLVVALMFTAVILPAVTPAVAPLAGGGRLLGPWLLTEVVVGLALGLALRMLVLALQTAGAMVAQATSLAQLFGGAGAEPQPAVGHLLVMGGLALAVMQGLHVDLARYLILSYDILPPGRLPGAADLKDWGLAHAARAFALAFRISAPFLVASLVYNLALGAINRAMPQLMVALVGAPALTLGGLALLVLAVPSGLVLWSDTLAQLFADPFAVPR